jgi:membrane-associated phospholipid phosphatase
MTTAPPSQVSSASARGGSSRGALPARTPLGRVLYRLRPSLPWLVGLLAALLLDRLVYSRLAITETDRAAALQSRDLYRMFRVAGTLWPWLIIGAAMLLLDLGKRPRRARDFLRRPVFLLLSAALAGLAAESLKPLVGRYKPENTDGHYVFAAFSKRLTDWHDLGMASSHAAVAFGAAFALSLMLPRAAPLFLVLAIGCAVTRLLAGAHFLSDVYVAVLLAYAVTTALYHLDRRNNDGRSIDQPTTA